MYYSVEFRLQRFRVAVCCCIRTVFSATTDAVNVFIWYCIPESFDNIQIWTLVLHLLILYLQASLIFV